MIYLQMPKLAIKEIEKLGGTRAIELDLKLNAHDALYITIKGVKYVIYYIYDGAQKVYALINDKYINSEYGLVYSSYTSVKRLINIIKSRLK